VPDPEPVATSVPVASEFAQPPPSASGTSAPIATTPPTAPATERPPQAGTLGAKCRKPRDCQPPLVCVAGTDGAHLIAGSERCVEPGPRPGGRPLVVDGSAYVATPIEAHEWHEGTSAIALDHTLEEIAIATLRAQLLRDALDEHASVASFARTMCQLVALGAPAWLVEKTERALADEIVHARKTLAWVERLGGTQGPGRLPQAVAPFPAFGEGEALGAELLRDVVRGGCVGETLAAHEMSERAITAPFGELRALYTKIAADEARHAALAYETALWLLATFPSLAPVMAEEQTRLLAEMPDTDRALLAPLLALLTP